MLNSWCLELALLPWATSFYHQEHSNAYTGGFVGPQTDALDGIGGTDYTLMIVFVSVLILTLVIEIRPAIPSHGPDTALITTSFN